MRNSAGVAVQKTVYFIRSWADAGINRLALCRGMRAVDFIKSICLNVGSIAPLQHAEFVAIPMQTIDRGIKDRKITR